MDRSLEFRNKSSKANWKMVVEKQCSAYIPLIEGALKKYAGKGNGLDPLLLVALMKRESAFDPLAISSVGAAGLLQIMPKTARELGMKNIYSPPYFKKAMGLSSDGRKSRKEAMSVLFQINEKNKVDLAAKARRLMQKSLSLTQEKEQMLARYRSELLKKKNDDRLHPKKVIDYGCKYFSALLRKQKGDISLALASYNAGPHRIKQYNGIPPYEETVKFRNVVLQFYKEYLQSAGGKETPLG
ncbi:MAG: transglycosylase SLT domain-containing protein [Deltaproteobacteria bacterium]|nr:transglycosylase SLT domain-containing protein [Deltaproteobacteria bacterium]